MLQPNPVCILCVYDELHAATGNLAHLPFQKLVYLPVTAAVC
jgi:hypothetical protein